jgi:hypothetical protein
MVGWLCCAASAHAAAPDYTGLAGPALFLWALGHPLDTIKGLASVPAERRRQEAFRMATAQCEAEQKGLPESIEIDSFIDEGAALRGDLIYELLVKRSVKAIYVRPQPVSDGRAFRFAYPDGSHIGSFTYPASSAPQGAAAQYLKLEVGREEDGNCLPAAWTPVYAQERYKVPPALPKVCLAYSFTANANTRHALRYQKSQTVAGEQFGTWSIVDLTAGKALASLTTVDLPTRILSGGPSDCRSPYSVLAWRIQPDKQQNNPFALRPSIVVASRPFPQLIADRENLPLVPVQTVKTPYTAGEWEAASSPTAQQARWQQAVHEATRQGIGHYDGQGAGYHFSADYRIYAGPHGKGRILNWKQGSLVGLQLVETGTEIRSGINWDVSASEGGFLAFTTNWDTNQHQIIARYDIEGTLSWAVRIHGQLGIRGCGFGPGQAWATPTEIVLKQPSCHGREGMAWRLEKAAIAFYRTQVDAGRQRGAARHP